MIALCAGPYSMSPAVPSKTGGCYNHNSIQPKDKDKDNTYHILSHKGFFIIYTCHTIMFYIIQLLVDQA